MPESLCVINTVAAAASPDDQPTSSVDEPPNGDQLDADVDGSQPEHIRLRAQLVKKELIIERLSSFYAASQRDIDEKLKLERKVEIMRLELQQANDERKLYQQELQQLKKQQQTISSSSISHSSGGTVNRSVSPYGGLSSGASSSTGSHNRAAFGMLLNPRPVMTPTSVAATVDNDGLHMRPNAFKSPNLTSGGGCTSGGQIVNNVSNSSSRRQIIAHSKDTNYRLLGVAVSDDDDDDEDDNEDDDDDDDDNEDDEDDDGILLFGISSGDRRPIITSSSTSQDLLMSAVQDTTMRHSNGASNNQRIGGPLAGTPPAIQFDTVDNTSTTRRRHGGVGSSRKRRVVRSIRKRLKRLWRRCAPCLDSSRRSSASGANISLLYTGLANMEHSNSSSRHTDNDVGVDESTCTTTTGYNSFN